MVATSNRTYITEALVSEKVNVLYAWDVSGVDMLNKSRKLVIDLDTRYMNPVVYAIEDGELLAVAYRTKGNFDRNYNYKAVIGVSETAGDIGGILKKMVSYLLAEYMNVKSDAPWWYSIILSAGNNYTLRSIASELGFLKTFPGQYKWNWSEEKDDEFKMVKMNPVVTKRYDDRRFFDRTYNNARAEHFVAQHLISKGKGSKERPPVFNVEQISRNNAGVTVTYSYIDIKTHRRTGGMHFGFQGNLIDKLPTGIKDKVTVSLDEW